MMNEQIFELQIVKTLKRGSLNQYDYELLVTNNEKKEAVSIIISENMAAELESVDIPVN